MPSLLLMRYGFATSRAHREAAGSNCQIGTLGAALGTVARRAGLAVGGRKIAPIGIFGDRENRIGA